MLHYLAGDIRPARRRWPRPRGLSGGGGLVRAAVLALGRGGRQVAGQARRAGLDRGRVAEHDLTAPGLHHLVGHDDEEVNHGYEDDEVDDAGDELAKIHECLRVMVADIETQAEA